AAPASRREPDFHDLPQCSATRNGRLPDHGAPDCRRVSSCPGACRPRGESWPVLHDHRADHQRDDRAYPDCHPAARRSKCRRGEGKKSDPGVRVPAWRVSAGSQQDRHFVRPGQPDLQGAWRRQADRGLRSPAAHRVRFLALRKTRDPDLLLGMLDRDADLRLVHTADKALHYILAENLEEFRKTNQVTDEQAAWEGGQRGVLTARRARAEGFCKAIAENPAEVAHIYQIGGQSAVEDPTLGQALRPIWIKINGPLDPVKVGYLSRRIDQARQEKVNLVFFQIDSPGGLDSAAD